MKIRLSQFVRDMQSTFAGFFLLQYTVWTSLEAPFAFVLTGIALILLGDACGRWLIPKEHRGYQILVGAISYIAALCIVLSGLYWFWYINNSIIAISIILVTIPLFLLPKGEPRKLKISFTRPQWHWLFAGIVMLGDATLLGTLIARRLGDTLISPWTLVGPKFFLVFFFTTTVLLFAQRRHIPSGIKTFLSVLHYVIFLCVAYVVYAYGFGFDPFIHQATEQWILTHGAITPKVPYYIGQYMLVLFSHNTTALPLRLIDQSIVPIGAAILMPLFALLGQQKKSWFSLALLPFVPLSFFIVTTPHTLSLLIAFLVVCWIQYEKNNGTARTQVFGWILVGMACVTHALIGVPLLLIYSSSQLLRTKKLSRLFLPYTILLILAVPAMFFVALGGNITLTNPFDSLSVFWSIFQTPHWFVGENPSRAWQLLYSYRTLIMPLGLIGIIVGLFHARHRSPHARWTVVTMISLIVSAFVLATTIWPQDIISYERANYATRLLELALICGFPYLLVTFQTIEDATPSIPKQLLLAFLGAILLTVSWYFTYPTRDPVSLHTGYAVRDADIEAVHFIDARNNGVQDYIVLTNQITGVAALREFGFSSYHTMQDGKEQYFYSIPTGAPLYTYFRRMVYEEPKRAWMEEAMEYADVSTAYFVHTNTWAPAATIRDAAKKEADAWWELANGRIWVYEYKK